MLVDVVRQEVARAVDPQGLDANGMRPTLRELEHRAPEVAHAEVVGGGAVGERPAVTDREHRAEPGLLDGHRCGRIAVDPVVQAHEQATAR